MTEAERDLIARQTAVIKEQLARITELESEVARLNAIIRDEGDALKHLRRLYTDPSSSVATVLRACDAAIPFERSRLPTVAVGLDLTSFAARLGAQRRGEVIDVTPDDEAPIVDRSDEA
jgi:hypothetical protein